MPHYQVRVQEPAGGTRIVRVLAEHPGAIAASLDVPASHILSVAADAAAISPRAGRRPRGAARLDQRLFAQQLSVLLKAGVPLLESLQTLREKAPESVALDAVMASLRDGQSLSTALQSADGSFDALFVAVVSASERNGQLAATLADHAAYLAWAEGLRARLVAAATYPVMLMGVGSAVVLFLMLYVMPRFASVFEGLGQGVPAGSRWLMQLSAAAAGNPQWTAAVVLGIPTLAWLAARSAPVRSTFSAWLWTLPQLGPRLREMALARLYRCLSHLLGAGVPALQALGLAEALLPQALRAALAGAALDVAAGHRLSQAFDARRLSTPVAARMLRVGESSGQSAAMLAQAAAFHDEEISRLTDLFVRVLNPLLMLVMGVVIGGIVVLMYLPIFGLMEQVQ